MSSKCGICSNTVYPVDPQINLNGSIYHKICAKCVDCRCQITLSNFTKSGDTLLCKTHYIKRYHEQGTHLGSDKFSKQAVRGQAAYNPATDSAAASAAPAPSTKDFADDPEKANSVKERMKRFASLSNTPKCATCDRSVYANDPQVVLDGLSYHRACAKCVECKCQITIQNFTKSGTTLYCKTHYLKKFNEEGTILGAEKFTHQSAPGKFAGSGFTIQRSESSVSTHVEEPAVAAPAPAAAPAPEPIEETSEPTRQAPVPAVEETAEPPTVEPAAEAALEPTHQSVPEATPAEPEAVSESDVKLEESQAEEAAEAPVVEAAEAGAPSESVAAAPAIAEDTAEAPTTTEEPPQEQEIPAVAEEGESEGV